ncbi:DUF5924 family protein [Salinisphaera sp. C84B14]|uniref:DUF5924 family protein n=1 Tax=Salinisphaera sp. C84B14 TaxID=1304155 RepID=UPI0033400C3C
MQASTVASEIQASEGSVESPAERYFNRLLSSRAGRIAYRYRRLLPVASFAMGAASFFLVERQAALAQWVTALMLLGWLALLFEGLLCRLLGRYFGERLPQAAVRFAAQCLHQETLFFVLPFFLATTTWLSGQALFTGLLIVAAAASTVDPIYLHGIAERRWLFLGFHGFTLFVALLAAGPIMLSLTTGESVAIASVAMGVCALPSFNDAVRARQWWRWLLLAALSIALGGLAWFGRFWIPPATLRATDMAITLQVDADKREPGQDRTHFSAAELSGDGLYAFTAIAAPRGLQQQVLHVWWHDGEVVDRIPLEITGGGPENGYRAWSHKLALGDDPTGHWRVTVITDDGQMIGARRFTVE